MLNEEKRFYFLEGMGTLLWVSMDVFWLYGVGEGAILFAVFAVLVNFAALLFAISRLDRGTVSLMAVFAYNLWVLMGALWVTGEFSESEKLIFIARIVGLTMILVAVWEFFVNRNNIDQVIQFMRSFRKFRMR